MGLNTISHPEYALSEYKFSDFCLKVGLLCIWELIPTSRIALGAIVEHHLLVTFPSRKRDSQIGQCLFQISLVYGLQQVSGLPVPLNKSKLKDQVLYKPQWYAKVKICSERLQSEHGNGICREELNGYGTLREH